MRTGNTILFFAVISGFFLHYPSTHASEKPPIFIKVGEQRLLPLPPFDRYSVSGTAIRYTRLPRENQLLIKGISTGMSTLLLTHNQNTTTQSIRVEAKLDSTYPLPLFQSLNLLENTETIDGGSQFILRGIVRQLKEAQAIAHLKKNFAAFVVDETVIEPHWLEQNIVQLSEVLKPYPTLKMLNHEGSLTIQGAISSPFAVTALMKKIQSIQPLTNFDFQTIKSFSPTLYFKVFLLEVKKDFALKLGTEITQPIEGTLPNSPLQSILNNTISYSISALSEKGKVRILSAPELVVKSPGQAELFSGGEIPIHIKNHYEDKVIWKNVGLSLKLDVKEYNGERILLTIETELNALNKTYDVGDLKGVKTNRIKTQVEGTMGLPLLLSGLIQEDSQETLSGLPGLSEIPVLGSLFGSKDYQNHRSELVAVLVPYREPPHEPMGRISSEIPKGFLPLPHNYISQENLEKLQASREYPWNVL